MSLEQDSPPASQPNDRRVKTSPLAFKGAALFVAIGLTISFLVFSQMSDGTQRAVQSSLTSDAEERFAAIERSLATGIAEIESLAGFIASQERIDRLTFERYVEPILERQSSLQAVEWIPRVFDGSRGHYERAAREDGLDAFQFREESEGAAMVWRE